MDQISPERSPLPSTSVRLRELFLLFVKLGFTAFGGPAAHIAMYRQEVVEKRKWLDEEHFLDLIGATSIIPGPNSTEIVMHLGYLRAGLPGQLVAGISFVIPAFLLVTGIAWVYKSYSATPQADALLYGIKPVIIAVILQALWGMGRKALKGPATAAIALGAAALHFLGVNEILLLAAGGLLMLAFSSAHLFKKGGGVLILLPLYSHQILLQKETPASLSRLFLIFLKIGSVLYGSGYVLLAFLQADLVQRLGWLNNQQLIDAVAAGQITPGPLFTTAAFVGFLLFDFPGALVATAGIFLPSFIIVTLTNPIIPRLRDSAWTGALLDGVIAASLGLMASVTWQLGRAALIDLPAIILALVAGGLLLRHKVSSTWLVLGGACIGLLKTFLF